VSIIKKGRGKDTRANERGDTISATLESPQCVSIVVYQIEYLFPCEAMSRLQAGPVTVSVTIGGGCHVSLRVHGVPIYTGGSAERHTTYTLSDFSDKMSPRQPS